MLINASSLRIKIQIDLDRQFHPLSSVTCFTLMNSLSSRNATHSAVTLRVTSVSVVTATNVLLMYAFNW